MTTTAIIKRGNRFQHVIADVASLPTTGVSLYELAESCDDNTWRYFNGTSWILLGTNTISPCPSIPGDVSGLTTTSLSPNAPFWWNSGDAGGMGLGTSQRNLPFIITTSNTSTPTGYLPGQKLFEADTGNWFRWDGAQWVRDASGAVVGAKSAAGGNIEKGGGIAAFTATANQTVFNIPHGIGAIPSIIMVCPASQGANGPGVTTNTIGYIITADATNIIITYGSSLTSNTAVKFNWFAQN